ncbi:MAG: LOG family protein [Phycisphaerae bacterium]
MNRSQSVFANRAERAKAREAACQEFLDTFAPGDNQDLMAEMMVTITRLAADGCGRGELKILNRALKELRYAFKIFAPYQEVPKITMFGSSRTPPEHPQYQQAVKFARLMRENGWMVITGAGDGIMHAGNQGATRAGSFGVAIALPFEQETNKTIAGDEKLVNFKYFFTRKLIFVKEAKAIALFPGGFGTQDEGFEAMTLVQTSKSAPVPIVLIDEPGGTYWQHWRTYVKAELLGNDMISPEDMKLFFVTDSAEEGCQEVVRFFRRYHSSRYVHDDFILRMNSPLPEEFITKLNDEFSDIFGTGALRQVSEPLPEENGEYSDLPRLVFRFDRRSVGRLRMLINAINEAD